MATLSTLYFQTLMCNSSFN